MLMKNGKWMKSLVLALFTAVLLVATAGAGNPPPEVSYDYFLYVSSPKGGTVDGIAYADEDVLRYESATDTWTMAFDGSERGLPAAADIDAFAAQRAGQISHYYMSFDKPLSVPGIAGTVDDSDVVRYSFGFGGTGWSLFLDGSDLGLTTAGEDIDALELYADDQIMMFSTSGNFSLPGNISGAADGYAYWNLLNLQITGPFESSQLGVDGGADNNDLWGLALSEDKAYVAMEAAFTAGGYDFAAGDIMESDYQPYSIHLLWDAGDHGFPKVDAIEVILP